MFSSPYIEKFDHASHILIAGAGGGFDIFCGLPLYFNLLKQGKNVYLANLSFTKLREYDGEWLTPHMMKVTAQYPITQDVYFPEWYLSQWLGQKTGDVTPIFAFDRTGVLPLLGNYQFLIEQFPIDMIVLIDGGTDSLMRGDEDGLGTPNEDFASLAAVYPLEIPHKLLICLGLGVDHYHGVSNDLTLNAIADLTQMDGFLGSLSLLKTMPEVQKYTEALDFVFSKMPENTSIVSSSILSALQGHYGDYHVTDRTEGSQLWINPLMSIYWFFELDQIAKRNLLLEKLYMTEFYDQLTREIMVFRRVYLQAIKQRQTLPS